MPRTPISVERAEYNVVYVRFREDREGFGRTLGFADHQINVDLDEDDRIIGIEILALGAAELTALGEVARTHDLDLSPLIGGVAPSLA